MNIYSKISDWIKTYPDFSDYGFLYFNVLNFEDNNLALSNISSTETILKKYLDGSKLVEVTIPFTVSMVKSYDKGTSGLNLTNIEDMQALIDWINTQIEADNYPDFDDGIDIEEFGLLQATPSEPLVNTDDSLVRYQFSGQIIYREERTK